MPRPRPEIVRAGELLCQQRGADDLSVTHHQAPVGLILKHQLRDSSNYYRIRDAGDEGPQERLLHGLDNELDHISSFLIGFYGKTQGAR